MIKIPKKQSYKPEISFTRLGKIFPLRIIIRIIILSFLYFFLPLYLAIRIDIHPFRSLFIFYLLNTVIAVFTLRKNYGIRHCLELEAEGIQEKNNILIDQNSQGAKNNIALREKIGRYDNLKAIIEEISQNLGLEPIADTLISVAFSLIANNKGTGLLYLADNQNYKLNLFKTKKEDKDLIIKTKEGDIFDLWVLRHTSPLLIEDAHKDFRFDLEKLKTQYSRPVLSLISVPLMSEHNFLGILRLDNARAGFYLQHDLRFLVTICDFGAIALENGELFQKTQDLAIHDGLTSLYTKGYFLERLKEECKRSIRDNRPLSLLMLDIDYFKNYNDKFGHTAGDIVLKRLSLNILEFLKDSSSVVSRFGGEEFCIILPAIDKKKASSLAEQLRAKIEKTKIILRRLETNITVSIGVASYPADTNDADELIFKSDRAMYEAKQKGRNRVCYI